MKTIFLFSLITIMSVNLLGQNQDIEKAAQSALRDMQKVITDDNAPMFGIRSAAELEDAKLGTPVEYQYIGLDGLKQFDGGQVNAQRLLQKLEKVSVPVLKDGKYLTSIDVEKGKEGWNSTGFGNMAPISDFEEVRRRNQLGDDAYLVRVPALNQYFVAKGRGADLQFALIGNSSIDLPRMEFIPAEEALKALQPLAERYNGLPW